MRAVLINSLHTHSPEAITAHLMGQNTFKSALTPPFVAPPEFPAQEQDQEGTGKHPSPFWQRHETIQVQPILTHLPAVTLTSHTALVALLPWDRGSAGALFPSVQAKCTCESIPIQGRA